MSVIDASQKEIAQVPAGKGPAQLGFTPDGSLVLVSLSEENAVAVIDPATRKVIRKVAVGTVPIQLYVTPDSRTLLVANQGTPKKPGKTVSLMELESFKVTKTVVTGAVLMAWLSTVRRTPTLPTCTPIRFPCLM